MIIFKVRNKSHAEKKMRRKSKEEVNAPHQGVSPSPYIRLSDMQFTILPQAVYLDFE